ncbi:MAG: PEP-CTERM sorting domain-containing protein [Pirellulales bacterium]|nr:PEP-CTERM sorting domain-containing protein [Pirellulales bacterium]
MRSELGAVIRKSVVAGAAATQIVAVISAGVARADVVLAPFSVQNGSLSYNYYGNGFGASAYNPLSSTDLNASNSYSSLATHSYSSYRVFALNFDLSQISSSAVVKSATLSVDESVTNYTAKLRLYATTKTVGLGTFSLAPFNDRTIAIQAATPTTFDLTSLVRSALEGGADHLTIAARNSGGTQVGLSWRSSVATWSNPQLAIVVPEPSTWAMLGSGAGLVLLTALRRQRRTR